MMIKVGIYSAKVCLGKKIALLNWRKTGKKIANSCKGLPLSITVIGGLLSRYKQSGQYWEYILENLNPILNSEGNEHCLKILSMNYKELPVHLKPCFLYMGIFDEDREISISWLIKLWIAEGFLKPIGGKSLEMVAEEYLKDLVDRNLIQGHKRGSNGEINLCKIHDLLRDLCLRECGKDRFLCDTRNYSNLDIITQRRIILHQDTRGRDIDALQSASLARSLICDSVGQAGFVPLDFRLLRVLKAYDNVLRSQSTYLDTSPFHLVNLRFLAVDDSCIKFPSSFHLLWNLQTLYVYRYGDVVTAPPEIWKMPLLRHVKFEGLQLPDPPGGDDDLVVLENLQALLTVMNFNCSEEVVKRIPNIKKLGIEYNVRGDESSYCLDNLVRLHKLESLSCQLSYKNMSGMISYVARKLILPLSLKKLTLRHTKLHWEDMGTKIGSLPHLQVLKLYNDSFLGPKWETVDGQFSSLKYLLIHDNGNGLEGWTWITDSTHFPCLESLVLRYVKKLKDMPLAIGDISTLQYIELRACSMSLVISARKVLEEQEELGNVGIQVRVKSWNVEESILEMASSNFHVEAL
ncbi:putative late blight resistance protein homolog r1c-3 [Phtheirospermum japonicum]|uniref:Putative late blight resistance protein homolog r1c-3 n=1 Tax=Phtheirospermum japonicum TaxID=374723 RepID=A0A830C0H2_9LAMI|nr:putative late blight resistance protein homolog r1c-3 [Phtheirospermum japonicum]